MESSGFNIVLGGGQKLSGDMENSKYSILLYDNQEGGGGSDFTAHEPPAYRSVYVADVQINEATGHLIVTLSDGTNIDSGYVRGSQGVPGAPGANGQDGHSPVVTAEKSGKTTVIKVDGVQIASIIDGTDGSIGPKGDSFQTSVEDDGNGNIVIKSLTGEEGGTGTPGVTFTPSVSADGVISWTNDGGLDNPTPINIKGPAGAKGDTGAPGAAGKTPVKGTDYFTEADKTEMVNAVLAALPNGDEAAYG